MQDYTVLWGAAIKPGEALREDAHRLPMQPLGKWGLVAVADGAGGKGVYVGKWAQTLVAQLPDTPFEDADAVFNWLKPIATQFYRDNKEDAQKNEHTWTKFLQEGSAATLTALWLPDRSDGNNAPEKAACMMYGDSPILQYHTLTKELVMPEHLRELSSFSGRTSLVNWLGSHPFQHGHCHFSRFDPTDQTILLATDAMAQMILIRYLLHHEQDPTCRQQLELAKVTGGIHAQLIDANQKADLPPDFDEWLQILLDTLNTAGPEPDENRFGNLLHQYYKQGLIEEDDYTLVVVKTTPNS